VSPVRTAAEREEQAELIMLREQADRTADEVAQTLAELTRRIDVVRRAGEAARRIRADARGTALRALRQGPRAIAGQPGVRRVALAAAPVLVLAVSACAARGKIKFGSERARVFARPVRSSVRRRTQQRAARRV
jgi:hypothetical protein